MTVEPPFNLIRREQVWPHEIPVDSGGDVRPFVQRPAKWVTGHHTGAGEWADFYDTIPEVRYIQMYAQHAQKPWEYNWIIDTEGNVVEYAGFYQAAHSGGENHTAYGVLLLLNATHEKPTDAQILAFRQLVWWLRELGYTSYQTFVLPHQQMPGARTACPGVYVMARWQEFITPWMPPPPVEPKEIDMIVLDYNNKNGWTALVYTGTHLGWIASGHADNVLRRAGVQRQTVTHDELLGIAQATEKTTAAPWTVEDDIKSSWVFVD